MIPYDLAIQDFTISISTTLNFGTCVEINLFSGNVNKFKILYVDRYAKKNGYPLLNNVTLPRIGALKTILDNIGQPESNTSQGASTGTGDC